MRLARILPLAVALLALPARSADTTLEVAPGETVGQFLERLAERLDALVLFPLEGVATLSAGGPHTLTLPEGRLLDTARFLLSLRDVELRAFGRSPTILAVRGRATISPDYRTPHLERTLRFNRSPGQWEREGDLQDTLAADSVSDLLGILKGAEPRAQACAALLLGAFGPPSPPILDGLRQALAAQDAAVRSRAAMALGLIGHAALPALEELDDLAAREGGLFVEAARRVREAYHPALLAPTLARERAPERFRVRFLTTKGTFVVEVERAWAPNGADRLYNLARIGYFKETAVFRVLPRFVAQWGIHGDPRVNAVWRLARIPDDPVILPNERGTLVFATQSGEKNSRTVQLFVNTADNRKSLDSLGFAPVGRVVEGLEVVDRFHAGYGDGPPQGGGPHQGRLQGEGNAYLAQEFPELDFIRSATLE